MKTKLATATGREISAPAHPADPSYKHKKLGVQKKRKRGQT